MSMSWTTDYQGGHIGYVYQLDEKKCELHIQNVTGPNTVDNHIIAMFDNQIKLSPFIVNGPALLEDRDKWYSNSILLYKSFPLGTREWVLINSSLTIEPFSKRDEYLFSQTIYSGVTNDFTRCNSRNIYKSSISTSSQSPTTEIQSTKYNLSNSTLMIDSLIMNGNGNDFEIFSVCVKEKRYNNIIFILYFCFRKKNESSHFKLNNIIFNEFNFKYSGSSQSDKITLIPILKEFYIDGSIMSILSSIINFGDSMDNNHFQSLPLIIQNSTMLGSFTLADSKSVNISDTIIGNINESSKSTSTIILKQDSIQIRNITIRILFTNQSNSEVYLFGITANDFMKHSRIQLFIDCYTTTSNVSLPYLYFSNQTMYTNFKWSNIETFLLNCQSSSPNLQLFHLYNTTTNQLSLLLIPPLKDDSSDYDNNHNYSTDTNNSTADISESKDRTDDSYFPPGYLAPIILGAFLSIYISTTMMKYEHTFRFYSTCVLIPILLFQILFDFVVVPYYYQPSITIKQTIKQNLLLNNRSVSFTPTFPSITPPALDYNELIRHYYQDPPPPPLSKIRIIRPVPMSIIHKFPIYSQSLYFGLSRLSNNYIDNQEQYQQRYSHHLISNSESISIPTFNLNVLKIPYTVGHVGILYDLFNHVKYHNTFNSTKAGWSWISHTVLIFYGIILYMSTLFIPFLRHDFQSSLLCSDRNGQFQHFCQTLSGSSNNYPGFL
ncbi:hypothetical protein DFA_05005 [Cavenderia fasciculata]|uniref:Transmembrane protein n=1 Tax=Cavenderia fasciculata TaxID=261658 RepID=F4PMY2_CACFS|nr:uncharacterized protein DFA_05005 [Cavenderia fasciculata]EGG22875.1 hypothetical protein DFA_05005 [Cavenderia fasciculata]|eukprot:XP_004360726.1 hypothetical protein DFA_05005 [Cavenderia fasciculata]